MSLTYPVGRVVTHDYGSSGGIDDAARRVLKLVDSDVGSTTLAAHEYLGLGTIVEVDHPEPDLQYTLIDLAGTVDPDTGDIYSGLDRFGRIKDCRWLDTTGPTDVARDKYGYDRASNRLWRENTVAVAQSKDFDELYTYDGLYRLKEMQRGRLNTLKDDLTTLTFAQCWTLDETGNWSQFRTDDNGNGTWDEEQLRTANTTNEITGLTPPASPPGYSPTYDNAGNLNRIPSTTPASGLTWPTLTVNEWDTLTVNEWDTLSADGFEIGRTFTYDPWNRLVTVTDGTDLIQTNEYNGRHQRIIRETTASASTGAETRHCYFSPGWQSLEERLGTSTNAERQYVWGLRYIDDCILRDRDTTANGTLDERFYPTQDANWNVTSLVDNTGTVQERYAYSSYGVPMFLTATYGARTTSSYDWETLFDGYRYDTALELFAVRFRTYHPELGVWLERDPIGYVNGRNLYEYVRSSPIDATDPFGLITSSESTEILRDVLSKLGGTQSINCPHPDDENYETDCQDYIKRAIGRDALKGTILPALTDSAAAALELISPKRTGLKLSKKALQVILKKVKDPTSADDWEDAILNFGPSLIKDPVLKKFVKDAAKTYKKYSEDQCILQQYKRKGGWTVNCVFLVCLVDDTNKFDLTGQCLYSCTSDERTHKCGCGTNRVMRIRGEGTYSDSVFSLGHTTTVDGAKSGYQFPKPQ